MADEGSSKASKEHCYIVMFALEPGRDSTALTEVLKSYTNWAHLVAGGWAIVSGKTAAQIRDELLPHITNAERLLVVKSGGVGAWRNFPNASEWLKAHL